MTKYELPFKIVHGFDYPEDMPEEEIRQSVSNRLASLKAKGFGGIVTALAGFPSVDYCAWTIMHHLEDYGGQRFEVGYSSAIATILFLMMIGSNMLIKKLLSKVGQ